MSDKQVKTRIVHKHDFEINWLKAAAFIPFQGELIIYDIEVDLDGNTLTIPDNKGGQISVLPTINGIARTIPYTYERFKIGDGIHTINNLPFTDEHYAVSTHTHDNRYYTEEEVNSKVTISGTVTQAIGGIAKDKSYENAALVDVLSDLLFPYIAPSCNSLGIYNTNNNSVAGTHEYGTSVTVAKVKPTFTKGSKNITTFTVGTSNGGSDLYSGATAVSGTTYNLTTSKTFDGTTGGVIYSTISDGTTSVSKSASISYAYYPYVLTSTSNSLTSVTTGATKFSSTATSSAVSLTLSTDSYVWFLLPPGTSGTKTIQYEALGQWYEFAGGTTGPVDVSLKLNSGLTVTYKGYRTNKMAAAGTTSFKIV